MWGGRRNLLHFVADHGERNKGNGQQDDGNESQISGFHGWLGSGGFQDGFNEGWQCHGFRPKDELKTRNQPVRSVAIGRGFYNPSPACVMKTPADFLMIDAE